MQPSDAVYSPNRMKQTDAGLLLLMVLPRSRDRKCAGFVKRLHPDTTRARLGRRRWNREHRHFESRSRLVPGTMRSTSCVEAC